MKGKIMFKKTFLTIAFIASVFVLTGCGKSTTTQPAVEKDAPAVEKDAAQQPTASEQKTTDSKTFDESMKKGLDQYEPVLAVMKNSFKAKNEYPNGFDPNLVAKADYPIFNYMYSGPKDVILEVELSNKVKAYFCTNKDMENCNPEVKKDGVTYTTYKDWVVATKK